jgi:hypothetical protein
VDLVVDWTGLRADDDPVENIGFFLGGEGRPVMKCRVELISGTIEGCVVTSVVVLTALGASRIPAGA